MTLDLSEVKKIAVQCGAEKIVKSFKSMNEVFYLTEFSEAELMKFAQAIYAMGAAEQKLKCERNCNGKSI